MTRKRSTSKRSIIKRRKYPLAAPTYLTHYRYSIGRDGNGEHEYELGCAGEDFQPDDEDTSHKSDVTCPGCLRFLNWAEAQWERQAGIDS